MSNLADELARQMASKQLDQVQLAELSGISQSQISRWLSSSQMSISEQQLAAVAPALSENLEDQAALVKAHLLDERVGPGSDLVTIEVESENALRDRPKPRSKGEQALLFLAEERVRNRDLNDLLIDLARILGGFEPPNSFEEASALRLAKRLSADDDRKHKTGESRPSGADATVQ